VHPIGASTLLIRPASARDVKSVAVLERESFAHPAERFGSRRVRYLIENPRFIILAAERDGNVVGWAAGFVHLRGKIPWGRVYAIAVDPHARGQRLGRRLMEQIIDALIARGARRIFLEVRADNRAAVRLYEKLGFAECRRLPNYYGHGIAGVRMQRVIGPSPAASS